jgi:LysM repeat protein
MARMRRMGALTGWLVGLAAATVVLVTSTDPLLARLGDPTAGPDTAVATAAAAAGWLVLGRLVLGVTLTLIEALTGAATATRHGPVGRLARALTPSVLRQAIHHSIRVGLVAGAVGSAVVTPTVAFGSPAPTTADVRLTDRTAPPEWPVLDRPAHPVPRALAPVPATGTSDESARPPSPQGDHYRVRPGDSLWSIAAQHLPTSASQADVARAWPRWWRVNRDVVGSDPSIIRPGQVLRVPGTAS